MNGYTAFARFYDALTVNVDYRARAALYDALLRRHAVRPVKLLLDLCCGTGSLSRELSARGYQVIGVDASADMLAVAAAKRYPGPHPLFLCQEAQRLDLYGTVDSCVSSLDSLNHLSPAALERAVARVALFLAPGGVFAFDVNTRHKHEKLLAGTSYVYETDGVLCIWRNRLKKNLDVDIFLDFFEPMHDGLYRRRRERFTEYFHPRARVEDMLARHGLFLAARIADDSLAAQTDGKVERVIYVAVKRNKRTFPF